MKPLIAVTGATGSTGSQVVAQLRQRDWPVRALVRQIDARSQQLRQLGAQVVVADLFEPDQLDTALRGTQRAYYCPPTHPHMLDSATAFAVAAQEAGVLGRTVHPKSVPPFIFTKAMRASGYDAFMTAQTRIYLTEHRRGTFAHGGPTDHVDQVTGRPAETFETTSREYAQLPAARRTPAQLARVLGNLTRTAVTPGGSRARPNRDQAGAGPVPARLAIDDPEWLATH